MRLAKKEPKLDEVKLVLKKLQHLDPSAEEPAAGVSPPGALVKANVTKSAAKTRSGRIVLYLSGAGAIAVVALVLFAAGIGSIPDNSKITADKSGPAGFKVALKVEDQSDSPFLLEARQALNEGDTLRARKALLRAEPERHAKVAFMLAQSYDPNYLLSLTKTNAFPDKAEAKRWYEMWYGLAVQSGLEMDSGRLQRIINAMR